MLHKSYFIQYFKNFIYLFFSCAGSSLLHRFFSSCGEQTAHCSGFSCCGTWVLGYTDSVVVAHGVPGHVESSQTRDQTCVSCIGRWILYHRVTREHIVLNVCLCHKLHGQSSPWAVLTDRLSSQLRVADVVFRNVPGSPGKPVLVQKPKWVCGFEKKFL